MDLKGSKTAENLMRSFAGESQARNRYTFYSGLANKEGSLEISQICLEIAEQERAHGKVFFKYLSEALQDEAVEVNTAYPVALHDNIIDNLKAAARGENAEWSTDYPNFAKIAREEGFTKIANTFENIAKVEKTHEARFNKLIKDLEENKVFEKDTSVSWMCSNCGYIYEGEKAPLKCPLCLHPQGFFRVYDGAGSK